MTEKATRTILFIVGKDEMLKGQLEAWLAPHRWSCLLLEDTSQIYEAADRSPALILLDARAGRDRWTTWLADIRRADGGLAGTPVVLIAPATTAIENGLNAILPTPLDKALALSLIETWAGPLDDHDFRALDNPYYRLVRLGGRAVADGLVARFADHLDQALNWLDAPEPGSHVPHQIAGLAGMIGYDEISRAWRAIDAGDSFDAAEMRAQIEAVVAHIRRLIPPALEAGS